MAVSDLSVGEIAARAGVPVSTIHYYEAEGLIESWRTPANHRRYDRRELRRVAIARVALTVGCFLERGERGSGPYSARQGGRQGRLGKGGGTLGRDAGRKDRAFDPYA